MKVETKCIMKPIPEGLNCGDEFTEEELNRIQSVREVIKTSEWDIKYLRLFVPAKYFSLFAIPEYPLLNIRMDDNFMARFLCGNYNSTQNPEKAADKIYALYKFRVSENISLDSVYSLCFLRRLCEV